MCRCGCGGAHRLKLIVDGVPDHELGEEPHDLSYVYAGYAPLSVRLVHMMLTATPQLDEMLKILPGPNLSYRQGGGGPPAASAAAPSAEPASVGKAAAEAASGAGAADAARPPVTLVVFLGGVTFAEITALRWLGRNATPKREYLIATTHITNGDRLMESVIESCENGLDAVEL